MHASCSSGQGLSLFGDRAMYLVLGIWVKTLTGSNTQAGLVFFVLALPGPVAPGFGLLVDRVRKRPLMIATDLGIALVLGALLLVHDRSDVWIIYAVTLALRRVRVPLHVGPVGAPHPDAADGAARRRERRAPDRE